MERKLRGGLRFMRENMLKVHYIIYVNETDLVKPVEKHKISIQVEN